MGAAVFNIHPNIETGTRINFFFFFTTAGQNAIFFEGSIQIFGIFFFSHGLFQIFRATLCQSVPYEDSQGVALIGRDYPRPTYFLYSLLPLRASEDFGTERPETNRESVRPWRSFLMDLL